MHLQQQLGILLLLGATAFAAKHDACELSNYKQFQSVKASGGGCATCLFPVYPDILQMQHASSTPINLEDKWILFFGDVTLRQMYGEFAAKVAAAQVGHAVPRPLHHTKHDCNSQRRRLGYQPPPFDKTPCYLNEKSCMQHYPRTGFGSNVTVTYEWKHLMYEDFDRTLFNSWETGIGPHIVFLSPGAHDCYHEPQDVDHHIVQLRRLAKHLQQLQNQTIVWVDINPVTYGAHGVPALDCVLRVNAAAAEEAAAGGFRLFSRSAMILLGAQTAAGAGSGEEYFPFHQPDSTVKEEVDVMLTWLACQGL